MQFDAFLVSAGKIGPEADFIEGVGKLDERLIIILDIDRILTKEEKRELAGIE